MHIRRVGKGLDIALERVDCLGHPSASQLVVTDLVDQTLGHRRILNGVRAREPENVIVSFGRDVDAPYLKEASLRWWGAVAEPRREAPITRFEAGQSTRSIELGLILEEWETPVRISCLECVVETAQRRRAVIFALHIQVRPGGALRRAKSNANARSSY